MEPRLQRRSTAFITGGAQGIGAAIAVGFASCGADVALADIANEGRMTAVAEHIRSLGRRAATCDVRDRGAVDVAVRQAAEALGQGPDILIASAGIIGQLEAAQDVSHSGWKEVIETNLEGSYNAARSCYPYMKQRGRGKVVFISSIAGARGAGAQVAYACSKGALLPLSNSLAAAWGKDNITVNTLLPGAVNTQMLNVMVQTPEMLAYLLSRIPLASGRTGPGRPWRSSALAAWGVETWGEADMDLITLTDAFACTYFPVDGGGLCLPMLPFQQPELFDLHGRVAFVTGAAQVGLARMLCRRTPLAVLVLHWPAHEMAASLPPAAGHGRPHRDGAGQVRRRCRDMGNEAKLEGVASVIRDQGRQALALKCDVRNRKEVEQAVERAASILGKLQPAEHVSKQVWDNVFATNVDGVYQCCAAAYPHMRERGGSIIVMSSIAGLRGFGPQVAYCASKGALLPLAKSLAAAWGKDNIRVNCLVPGAINTPFLDQARGHARAAGGASPPLPPPPRAPARRAPFRPAPSRRKPADIVRCVVRRAPLLQVVTTEEKLRYLMGRIPLARLGVGEDMVGPAVFLASPASAYMTGAELVVDGAQDELDNLPADKVRDSVVQLQQQLAAITDKFEGILQQQPPGVEHGAGGAPAAAPSASDAGAAGRAAPAAPAARQRIQQMSGEVVDSNPYSRLMALQRMGIVKNYEAIRTKTVAVVGMGGVGSVAAEMLTRCGIGRLLMYDYDSTLAGINPDVALESYTMNITTLEGFGAFKATLTGAGVCLELNQTWMESGVSEDAVSGHIQACGRLSLATSIPVTRYLGYSSLKDFFPSMDIKPNPSCANAACRARQAQWAAGAGARAAAAAAAAVAAAAAAADNEGPLHADNEWGIEVVADRDSEEAPAAEAATGAAGAAGAGAGAAQQDRRRRSGGASAGAGGARAALPEGVEFAMPAGGGVAAEVLAREGLEATEAGVDDLLAQLQALSS
eukprot:scaffold4.g4911.t1